MYNPFNSFILFFHKWTNGTRLDIAKAAASMLVCVGCTLVLLQWDKIPTIEDKISVEKYGVWDSPKDSLRSEIRIQLKHAYAYTNPNRDSSSIEVSARSYEHNQKVLDLSIQVMDSIIRAANLQGTINKDSLSALYVINVLLDSEQDFHAKDLEQKKGGWFKEKDYTYYESSLEKRNGKRSCPIYAIFAIHRTDDPNTPEEKKYGEGGVQCVNKPQKNRYALNLHNLRMNDISQSYYKLQIDGNLSAIDEISSLAIDFGGATRFAGISPAPDEITESGIIYTDKKKIERIRYNGLELFCQFLETANIQSIRIYLLTTIATLFFGIFIKILIEIAWRRLSPWLSKQAEKKRQSKPTSEQTS